MREGFGLFMRREIRLKDVQKKRYPPSIFYLVCQVYWENWKKSFLQRLNENLILLEEDKNLLFQILLFWKQYHIPPSPNQYKWVSHLLFDILYPSLSLTHGLEAPSPKSKWLYQQGWQRGWLHQKLYKFLCLDVLIKLPFAHLGFHYLSKKYLFGKRGRCYSNEEGGRFYVGRLVEGTFYTTNYCTPTLLEKIITLEKNPKKTYCNFTNCCPFCGIAIQLNSCSLDCAYKCANLGGYLDHLQRFGRKKFHQYLFLRNLKKRVEKKGDDSINKNR